MPKAYSYIRMSSQKQKRGDSLRRQLQLSESYAKKKGLTIDSSLKDLGVSAFKSQNIEKGELGVFLDKIQKGEINIGSYLLIESLDRLSRNEVLDALQIFMSIISSGVNIVTLTDEMVYSKESIKKDYSQLIISLTIMSRAHEESLQKSKRISMSWENKRQSSNQIKLTSRCPAWLKLDKDKRNFKVIPKRAKLIKKIFEYCKDGAGNFSITRKLNEKRIESWGISNGWHQSYIQKLLNNRSVLGEFQPHKMINGKRVPAGAPIPNYFPRIIEDDLFYLAKASKENRLLGGGRKGKTLSNLFSRIAKCGYCGTTMQFLNKGKPPKGGQYLICGKAHRNLGCIKETWSYKDFEKNFLMMVSEINLNEIFSKNKNNTTKTMAGKIELNTQIIKENKEQLTKLKKAFQNTNSRSETFLELAKELEDENDSLKEEVEILERKIIDEKKEPKILKASKIEIIDFVAKMETLKDNELLETRTKLSYHFQNLIKKITLFPYGTLMDEKRQKLSKKIFERFCDKKSDLNAHIKSVKNILSNKPNRYYVVFFENDKFRYVRPNFDDPTKYVLTVSANDIEFDLDILVNKKLTKTKYN
jgi:DNA invertase Pin-like site-specific DNA recombinase